MNSESGTQSIGCHVSSCQYHQGNNCELHQIMVEPCSTHGDTGESKEETLCGSFRSRQ